MGGYLSFMITLKWILKKYGVMMWNVSSSSEQVPVVSSCNHCNEPLSFTKG